MLEAASNPNAETPEVIIRTLAPERRVNIDASMRTIGGVLLGVSNRGKAALMAMSDEDFEALVNADTANPDH